MTKQQAAESDATTDREQVQNGLETGCSIEQLVEITRLASVNWRDHKAAQADFLRALCDLSVAFPDKAKAGFSSIALYERIVADPKRLKDLDPSNVSKDIKSRFEKLRGKEEALEAFAKECGLQWYPALRKETGGGAGNPSRYRLTAVPVTTPEKDVPAPQTSPGQIRYVCEDSIAAWGWVAAFARGIEMKGRSRWVFISFGVLVIGAICALPYLAFLGLLYAPLTRNWLNALLLLLILTGLIYREFMPIFRVVTTRVVRAPQCLQLWDEDRLLEWRCPPRHPNKVLRLVRYSGVCPLCDGRVTVSHRNWWAADDDLVGRCEEAPRAHIFSFDHVLRLGDRLSS